MACHPSGIVVDVVGIHSSTSGRSCDEHECCGVLVKPDVVVRFRVVQLERTNDPEGETEATAIAVHVVSGGLDTCRVGFLGRHLIKYHDEYDARLAQITEVFDEHSESPSDRQKHHRMMGCARATLIEAEYRESPVKGKPDETPVRKKKRGASDDF